MLFQKDERPRRDRETDTRGVQEGDRPLAPRGGGIDGPPTRDYGAPAGAPRSAAPVTVERGELAPLVEPSPSPPIAAGAPERSSWDTRTVPGERAPSPRRESGLAPPVLQPPIAPSRSGPRPALEGLNTLPPKALEDIVNGLELPSKSAVIAALWPEPWRDAGPTVSPAFEAIRIETLRRAGAIDALRAVLERSTSPTEPTHAIVVMRAQILVGNRDAGCALASGAIRNRASLPAGLRRDAGLAAGYCALVGGNAEATKLAADLIRGEGNDAAFARAVLEGVGAKGRASPPLPATVSALEYRIGEAAGLVWPNAIAERAEPAVLATIATAQNIDPGLRVLAAERAARLSLIAPEILAEQYRALPQSPEDMAHPIASRQTGALRRALFLQAAEAETVPAKRARLIAALMEDAGRAGLRTPVARTLGTLVARLRPDQELAWFAETAAEIMVFSKQSEWLDAWVSIGRDIDHWRVLGALAEESGAPDARLLASIERVARAGRIDAPRLHRLVTVLDALDVQVPIPLWEAASRTAQPKDGHLPATGVLAELKRASDGREGARTILRAAQALGPSSPADTNLLTLGDVIRALKGAGFVREARALGVEALAGHWATAAAR